MDDGLKIDRDVRAAVVEATERESLAYYAKDYGAWAACWLHSPRTTDTFVGPLGAIIRQGWDDVASAMARVMRDDPDPLPLPFRHDYTNVTVRDDIAWLTFDSYCQVAGDEIYPAPDSSESRVLERHDGRWVIVHSTCIALRTVPPESPLIRVDGNGRVIWAANATIAALRDHPKLTISAGRLRAARPAWDKALQAAIDRAGELHHLFQFERTARILAEHLIFPVVLGEDESGGVQSCIVYVRDGGTYVSFDDGEEIARRLKVARMLFGLSNGQMRLAERIVAGRGLTDAAADLEISINTARTHLSRVFDKTGVHSQPALVRALMSAGAVAT